jgi:hypothetical protein
MEDWKYHISLALPEGISDETLANIYNIVETEIKLLRFQLFAAQEANRLADIEIERLRRPDLWNCAREAAFQIIGLENPDVDRVQEIIAGRFKL